MKIAFPLLTQSEMAIDFSRSKYVGIYDDELKSFEMISLLEKDQNFDFSSFFQSLLQQNLSCVISPFFTFMSLRVFRENNLETLKAEGLNVEANIDLFQQKELKPFVSFDAFKASGCSSSCISCETSCKI